jgi:hypothetical protein
MKKIFITFSIIISFSGFAQPVNDILEFKNFNIDSQAIKSKLKSVKVSFDHCNNFKDNSFLIKRFTKEGLTCEMIFGLPDSNFVYVTIQQNEKKKEVSISGTPLSFYMKSVFNDFSPYGWPDYDYVKQHRFKCEIKIKKKYFVLKDSSVHVVTKLNGVLLNEHVHRKEIMESFFNANNTLSPREIHKPSVSYLLLTTVSDSTTGLKRESYDWLPGDNVVDLELEFNKDGLLISRTDFQYTYSDTQSLIITKVKRIFNYNLKCLVISEVLFENDKFICKRKYDYEYW